jgi:hypothetical protein
MYVYNCIKSKSFFKEKNGLNGDCFRRTGSPTRELREDLEEMRAAKAFDTSE